MRVVTLYRIDASTNMWRFYRLDLQPDLFGLSFLVAEWGRIGSFGQSQVRSFAAIGEAQQAFDRQRRIKEKRGYADTKLNGTSKCVEQRYEKIDYGQ